MANWPLVVLLSFSAVPATLWIGTVARSIVNAVFRGFRETGQKLVQRFLLARGIFLAHEARRRYRTRSHIES